MYWISHSLWIPHAPALFCHILFILLSGCVRCACFLLSCFCVFGYKSYKPTSVLRSVGYICDVANFKVYYLLERTSILLFSQKAPVISYQFVNSNYSFLSPAEALEQKSLRVIRCLRWLFEQTLLPDRGNEKRIVKRLIDGHRAPVQTCASVFYTPPAVLKRADGGGGKYDTPKDCEGSIFNL